MSAATAPSARRRSRVLSVIRLHLANTNTLIVIPWAIMAVIFAVNYAIWVILASATEGQDRQDALDGTQYSGASFFIFVYMMVVAVQAINLTFPFALGYGVTRREFAAGTGLLFVGMSALYAVVLAVLGWIERLTDGWGIGGSMFQAVYFGNGGPVATWFVFFCAFVFFFFVGAAVATIYARWRMRGMLVFWVVGGLSLVVAVAAITYTGSWPRVGEWFAVNGAVGVAAWSLVLSAVAALAGFLVLRRATPKN